MLAFRDFIPQDDTPMLALSRQRESVSKMLERVNAWVAQDAVRVINVETVTLPESVASASGSSGTFTDGLQVDLGMFEIGGTHVQVLRVWYSTP